MISGSAKPPARTCTIEIVNTTKVAPIRIDAFWSAIWLSETLICCAVRTKWMALGEKIRCAFGSRSSMPSPGLQSATLNMPTCRRNRLACVSPYV